MAAYSIEYSNESVSALSKLSKKDCSEVIKRIEKLQDFPERFIYSLSGTKLCSMRAGDYRVLVSLDRIEKKVFIVTVGHRKNVYDRGL
jgi:mRNA interferase RelE/StbE